MKVIFKIKKHITVNINIVEKTQGKIYSFWYSYLHFGQQIFYFLFSFPMFLFIVPAPPCVDFCHVLSQNFGDLVIKKLDENSREAIVHNRDPKTMQPMEQKRVHRAILQAVFGK